MAHGNGLSDIHAVPDSDHSPYEYTPANGNSITQATASPTPVPTPTATPEPTAIPSTTPAPIPTPTALPTPEPPPAPEWQFKTDGANAHAALAATSWWDTSQPQPVLQFSRLFTDSGHCRTFVLVIWGVSIAFDPFTIIELDDRYPESLAWDHGSSASRKYGISLSSFSLPDHYAIYPLPTIATDNRAGTRYIRWLMDHNVLKISVPKLGGDPRRIWATFELEGIKEVGGQILSRC